MNLQYLFLFFLLAWPYTLNAQTNKNRQKSLFEFSIGINGYGSSIKQFNPNKISNDTLDQVHDLTGWGVTVGIACPFQLKKNLALRMGGVLSMKDIGLKYSFNNDHPQRIRSVGVNYTELLLHLIYENQTKPLAPAIILGPRYSLQIASEGRYPRDLDLRRYDFLLDIGIGIRYQIKNFHLRQELILSRGFINQLSPTHTYPLNNVISSIYNNTLHLRIVLGM